MVWMPDKSFTSGMSRGAVVHVLLGQGSGAACSDPPSLSLPQRFVNGVWSFHESLRSIRGDRRKHTQGDVFSLGPVLLSVCLIYVQMSPFIHPCRVGLCTFSLLNLNSCLKAESEQ